jgi:iron complex outermembrane recepter protein
MTGSNRIAVRVGRASAVALAVAGCLQIASAAEPAADTKLEEIVVTAERRETTESTTAISMNVLSSEDLASTRTQNIADLQQTTPNVTINQPGGPFNSINIRGIGNSAIQPSITTGVAVFQDGMLAAETITLSGAFLDLANAEVLRGPQGTFIGASSTGGAILMNSVTPDFKGVSGYVDGVIGSRSDTKFTGAVNLPMSDTFAARVAFNAEKRKGWFRNQGTVTALQPSHPFSSPGQVNDLNARVTLLWKPSEHFEALWRSETNQSDNGAGAYKPNPRTFTNSLGAQTHSRYWNYDVPGHDPRTLYQNIYETKSVGIVNRHSLELKYTLSNDIVLRSLTGFVHNENQYIEDQDGSIANASLIRNDVGPENNYYSQEFNLISPTGGRVDWILGSSFFYRATPVNLVIEENTCGISPADGSSTACVPQFNGNVPGLTLVNSLTTTRTAGLFGQVNYKLTDALKASVGVRMNFDRNFSTGEDGRTDSVIVVIPAPPGVVPGFNACLPQVTALNQLAQSAPGSYSCLRIGGRQQYQANTPTWKLGLEYRPNDKQFAYLFWSHGYKSGGVDNQGQFDAEKVDDYELGWKGTFADGHAQLNLGGFWMNYQNMQQSAFRASAVTAGNTVYNIGSSTIKGVEVEFNAKLGGFGLNASAGYTQSQLGAIRLIDRAAAPNSAVRAPGSNQDLAQCTGAAVYPTCADWTPYYKTLSGQSNIYSPKLSYTANVDYEFVLSNGATLTPKLNFSHTDAQDTNLIRREEYYSIPKRDLMNLSLTYKLNEWLVQAYCNNCSDKTYIASVQGTGTDNVIYGAPRNFGLRARRSF